MPYLGRAPTGTGSVTEIDGDLKITGQLTANDTLFKQIMDGTDGSSTNAGDNILIEDGGTDGSGTNAGDDICLEKDMQVVPAGDIISISGVAGAAAIPADAFEFVSVVTADDSADNVAFTNHESGYDYQYRWSNLTPATNDSTWRAQLGTSGPTYITSGYLGTSMEVNHAASVTSYEYTGYMSIGANAYDGTEPDSGVGIWDVFDPAGSGVTKVMGQNGHRNSGHTFYNGLDFYYNTTAASHTAIKFYFAAGNVEAGVIVQYRRKLSA